MTLSGRYTERSSGVAFISFGASEKVGRVARMKTLIQVLEPVWKLSFWVGVFPDWCHSPPRKPCSIIFNRIAVFISTLILTVLTSYQTFYLIIDFLEITSIKSIIFSLIGFFPQLTAVVFSFYIQLRRNTILKFFKFWNELECHPVMQNRRNDKKMTTLVIISMVITFLVNSVLLATIFFNSNSPLLLTRHPKLVATFTRPVLLLIQSLSAIYVSTILLVGGGAPTFIAYETGSMLNALSSATKQIFDDLETSKTKYSLTKQLHDLWHFYEQLRLRTDEANNLFGILVLLEHATFFLIICLAVDTFVLNTKTLPLADLIILPVFFFFFVLFLVAMTLIASESEKSSRKLAVTVSLLISKNGSFLTETERLTAASYLNNIQSNVLTARPCELYDINNSLLLQILGTIVTYTIIILQSA